MSFGDKVIAVDRLDGSIVWKWKAKRYAGLVSLLPSGDRLFVSINGYTWSLDPSDGAELWFQPFKGEGFGIATIRDGVSNAALTGGAAASASGGGGGDDGGD